MRSGLWWLVFVSTVLIACEGRPPVSGGQSSAAAPPPVAPAAAAASPESAPGALSGEVKVVGQVPAQPPFPTTQTALRTCGKSVPDETVLVGRGGGLWGAVVFVADAKAAPGDPGKVTIDQKGCRFLPPVVAARAGASLEIVNSDPLVHNVRATRGPAETWINVAMPLEGMKVRRPLPSAPGIWKVQCDVHPWMRSYVRTFDHPWFAVTDAQGRFRIDGVPAGHHRIGVWHPRFGEKELEVDVPASGAAAVQASWRSDELLPR